METNLGEGHLTQWLAAVGVTKLVPGARLAWRDQRAVFSGVDLAAIEAAWPTPEAFDCVDVVGGDRRLSAPLVEDFRTLVRAAPRNWMLTSAWSDMGSVAKGDKANPLDVCVRSPWLPENRGNPPAVSLRKALAAVKPSDIERSLVGDGVTAQVAGLGIDPNRLDELGLVTDPVVEVLAFFGLAQYMVWAERRRVGRDWRWVGVTRGWRTDEDSPYAAGVHVRPTWSEPLTFAQVDAWLDFAPEPAWEVMPEPVTVGNSVEWLFHSRPL